MILYYIISYYIILYVPLNGDNFWSIMVATSEAGALAHAAPQERRADQGRRGCDAEAGIRWLKSFLLYIYMVI